MIIKTYADRMAEIHISLAKEVPAAMDLVRMLIANGAIAAKIIKAQPATGEPAINVAHNIKERKLSHD